MRAFRALFALCFVLGMITSCASVESGAKEVRTELAHREFSRGRPPSEEQLSIGKEWSCYRCLVRDRNCAKNMVKVVILKFDDIYILHPRTVEDEDGTRVSGQAFMFHGKSLDTELMSEARGDSGVAYLRFDAFSDNLLLFNDSGWDAVHLICEDPKPPLHFWDPISS